MALLQIAEPGESTAPHEHKLAVGIDLGTTNSLVASVRSGEPETLQNVAGEHLLPSIVHYGETVLVGKEAEKLLSQDPKNTLASIKRLMGRSLEDVVDKELYDFDLASQHIPRIITRTGHVTPVEVSATILDTLRLQAEATLGGELTGAVVTVPAYFDDAQRQATKDAAKIAGLHILRLLNEPTAAAIAYGLDTKAEGNIAVFDLGGGTFDVSVLRLHKGVFEVLSTAGDTALGGDDFDQLLVDYLLSLTTLSEKEIAGLSANILRAVKSEARVIKELLSGQDLVNVNFSFDTLDIKTQITKAQFDELSDSLVKKTLLICRKAIRDANIELDSINNIVMVGGSTRMPVVREKVSDFFKRPVLTNIDPDKVVAIGAAIQADVLAGNKSQGDMLLLDVLPLSLGVETMGGLVEKIIPRNTTIPVAKAQEFTTFKDGQTAMMVHTLQGERDLVVDCRSLAKFELHGIPPMVAGAAKIRITYQVDADGLLNVSAQELQSGVQAEIQVKPSFGLSEDEVTTMLQASQLNAGQDMQARSLREQQVEAQRVIVAVDSALAADGDALLSVEEKSKILEAKDYLLSVASGTDEALIKQAIEQCETVSTDYVARRMDNNIKSAMAGHNIEEY